MARETKTIQTISHPAAPSHFGKDQKLQLALLSVLKSKKLLSRAEIAVAVGCTRATASKIVDFLISSHILEEQPTSIDSSPGRPAVPLRLVSRRFIGIGVEINVGYIAIRVVDLNGDTLVEIIEEKSLKNSDPIDVLHHLDERLITLYHELQTDKTTLLGATIAVPGLVDTNSNTILRAPNLNWMEISPCRHMEFCKTVKNIRIVNEANAAALASTYSKPGIPSKNKNFIYISGEFGVGGALIINHEQIPGMHGWAGEFGHVCVDPSGPRCSCGSTGCLEQYLGRKSLSKMAGFDEIVSMRTIHEASKTDKIAKNAIEIAGRALGQALTTIINVTDISTVIIGGTLKDLSDDLRIYALQEIQTRLISTKWVLPTIKKSQEGRLAAVTGGAYLVFTDLLSDPAKYLTTHSTKTI